MSQPKGVADHPAKELMEEIWRSGGRATEIIKVLEEKGLPVLSRSTIARYGQRYWTEKIRLTTSDDVTPSELQSILDEVESSGLGKITKINYSKKQYANGNEGVSQIVEIRPIESGPEFERAEIAPIIIQPLLPSLPFSQEKPEGMKLAVVLPDMQIGYHRNMDGSVTTTHDESAIDVAHQIMAILEAYHGIDAVINLGDNLDFPGFSSHRTAPGFLGPDMTQMGIDRYGTEMATQRGLAPTSDIWAFNGNHEDRLNKAIVDKIPALHGLSRAGDEDPVLSIPYLCKFDEYNVKGIETYPDGCLWLNDYLRFVHGGLASSTLGATAAKHLSTAPVSTVYGHIHRHEMIYDVVSTGRENRDVFAGSPGCLARLDGHLPSARTGISSKGGQAGGFRERWQHGVFVIWYETSGRQSAYCQPIPIDQGNAVLYGRRLQSRLSPNGEKIDE